MADIKISQMTAGTPDENTLFEGSLNSGGGVYNTRSVSASALATLFNTTMQYGGLSTTDDTIVGSINEVAKDHNVSDEYDSTQTYVVGDLCIYGNNLFECNTDITIPEPFDANKWTPTTLDAVIPRDANDIPYSAGVSVADKLDSLSSTSTETRSTLVTLPTGSSLNANIQRYGKLVVINLVGYLAPAFTSIGDMHFTNLPKLDGISELYAITPKGRFRLYNDGDVASIRLYDTNNTSSYIGVPFVYITP